MLMLEADRPELQLQYLNLLFPFLVDSAHQLGVMQAIMPTMVRAIGGNGNEAAVKLLLTFAHQSPMTLKQVVNACPDRALLETALRQALSQPSESASRSQQKTLDLSRYH